MTTVTAQALQKLWWKSWEWTPEEKNLEWMVHIDTRGLQLADLLCLVSVSR